MLNDSMLLELLCCTNCRGPVYIAIGASKADDGHIISGKLCCENCRQEYPIVRGIPRFIPGELSSQEATTVSGFGYQWNAFEVASSTDKFCGPELFLDFIAPVTAKYFNNKTVLDAGCGAGRFTSLAHKLGSWRVVGVDLSNSVEAAFINTRHLSNVLIIQADLFALPLRECFDYAFSVGVVHHTKNPREAFRAIAKIVVDGGGVSAWVYGREGNGWIVHILNPIRRNVTSHLPRKLLRMLSWCLAIPLYCVTRVIYGPVGRYRFFFPIKKFLFYFDYLNFISRLGFRGQGLIIFDHLVPELTEYIWRDDFTQWFRELDFRDVTITQRNSNSWRGFGIKPVNAKK